ncbi:MAG: cytochrome b/b6 domain-containing protein [Gammaproteobacteria bacterium]|nr:cytochrome b/b6 domain-containing protein [Gammaproteobacteria bacterium]
MPCEVSVVEIATYKNDVWGREVLLGVSWELLWLVIVVPFVFIALHAIFQASRRKKEKPSSGGERVRRHDGVDRLFHWVMAASVFVLLITGVFPIIGINFSWLTIHWVAGIVLTLAVVFHIVRSLFWQDLKSMWIAPSDLRELSDTTRKPGKYSLAQKGMHATVAILTLMVIISGLILFAMIDTPWWDRSNALTEATLGMMFFLHGVATLALIALICLHIYFGLRPEKLFYTRSMISGWISRDELAANHDPKRWAPDKSV